MKTGSRKPRSGRRGAVAAFTLAVAGLSSLFDPSVAGAQGGPEMRALIEQVGRLQRDLNALQQQVYGAAAGPSSATVVAVSENAAPSTITPTQVARLQVRITELETELRNLTGRVEEFGFKIDTAGRRLDKLVEDVDFRLTQIERGIAASRTGPPAETSESSETSETSEPAAIAPAAGADGETAPQTPSAASGPQTLGTISAGDLSAGGGQQVAALPAGAGGGLPDASPQEQYDFAYRLLRQGDYAQAERAFGELVALYPGSTLAPNAQYWLGETYYVREDFTRAAAAFLDGYQNYPDSAKAGDSLLKLGMSLGRIGEIDQACQTLGEVLRKYRQASASIGHLADAERARLKCD